MPRKSRTVIAMAIAFVLVMLGAATAAYIVFVKAPTDLARNTAEGIKEFFQFTPQVRIDQTIVIEQTTPILEVATLARDVYVEHQWSHTWLGSTKIIGLQGTFTAKAGFDLHDPFRILIEKNPLRVVADLPPAKLLSIQINSYRVVKDENGWWNQISDQDRERAVWDLQELARTRAEASGMLNEARTTAEQRIREIVERNGSTVAFQPLSKE